VALSEVEVFALNITSPVNMSVGAVMAIKMPILATGQCDQCKTIADYYFNEYGAISNCDFCNSAPINIEKVQS